MPKEFIRWLKAKLQSVKILKKMVTLLYNLHKGYCKYESNCSFAHGDHELRTAADFSQTQMTGFN